MDTGNTDEKDKVLQISKLFPVVILALVLVADWMTAM